MVVLFKKIQGDIDFFYEQKKFFFKIFLLHVIAYIKRINFYNIHFFKNCSEMFKKSLH